MRDSGGSWPPGSPGGMTEGERLPYTLAVHRGDGENPHAHLMFSERVNDGIERSREQWFRCTKPEGTGEGRRTKIEGGVGAGLDGQDPRGMGERGE